MRVLHPQHAHMLDVKHSLIHLLGHHEGYLMADLSDKQLQMKEENAQNILSIAEKLLPGRFLIDLLTQWYISAVYHTSFRHLIVNDSILGISRLKGTTLYELYLTHQQRGMNWKSSKERSEKDVLAAFKVFIFVLNLKECKLE